MSLGHPLPRTGAPVLLDAERACDLRAYVAWVQQTLTAAGDDGPPPFAAAQLLAGRLAAAGRAAITETPAAGLRIVMLGVPAEVRSRHIPALLRAWTEAALLRLSAGARP